MLKEECLYMHERLSLLILQPTSFCNIHCNYCYLPNLNKKMDLEISKLSQIFKNLLQDNLFKKNLQICWHLGEPLSAGIPYYISAFKEIKKILGNEIDIEHLFQTNGTLITKEWCDFFLENNVKVGVSLDGPENYHDKNRVTRKKQGTFKQTMEGIDFLKKKSNKSIYYLRCH